VLKRSLPKSIFPHAKGGNELGRDRCPPRPISAGAETRSQPAAARSFLGCWRPGAGGPRGSRVCHRGRKEGPRPLPVLLISRTPVFEGRYCARHLRTTREGDAGVPRWPRWTSANMANTSSGDLCPNQFGGFDAARLIGAEIHRPPRCTIRSTLLAMAEFARKILEGVERLRRTDRGLLVFGASGHRYRFNARATEKELVSFERCWSIELPPDYREFLLAVGNGGAGPFYGIFRLGEWDGAGDGEPWQSSIIGDASSPFPHRTTWNEPRNFSSAPDEGSLEYDRWMDEEDARYYSPALTNGSIPICAQGCRLGFLLVVTGEEAGNLWSDDRADEQGLTPLGEGKARLSFSDWYLAWMDDAVRANPLRRIK
jgi:hypothetical protein